ncbi:MAG TPA: pilus assembly protein N-terminal domain-containing protein, partial [Acidobacteriaceae bacterium]|nr:pilus assembly protein N-terminal domain-containing protein [Acidobacteriaceae bacterium]
MMALTSKNSKMLVGHIGPCILLACAIAGSGFAQETGAATASIVDAATGTNAIASVGRTGGNAKTLHVTLGHSIFINTRMRLKRVYVADPGVLTSATLTPNQIVVTAMNPGLSSLTLLDETGQAQSYVVSSDIDLDGLRSAMAEQMKGYNIAIEGAGGRVTLTGTVPSQALADSAAKLAGLYAKDVANALVVAPEHPKQVRLQVRILEVDRNKALQLGVNLFNPGGNTNWLAQTTTGQYSSTMKATLSGIQNSLDFTNPLNFMLYSAKLNLGATIQDLQTKQVLQILAEPTITTISGEKANFLSGGEFPFPVVQPSGTASVVTIQFRPFGVKLEFTPIVNPDGTVRLKVAPEVSALDYTNAVTVSGFSIPALSTRRAETEVELRSSQSFAISGLLDQRTTDIMSKNPGAANIPILGYLFKSKNVNHSTTELVIIVTPTVVDPITENAPPAEQKMPIPTLDSKGFDNSLGKNLSPNQTPPPINPEYPPLGGPAPPAPSGPAATAPAAAPAQGTADGAKPADDKSAPAVPD